jgi:hypothetical protein
MNQKHKEAFQELRQWCEKWDAEISLIDVLIGETEYQTMFGRFYNRTNYIGLDGFAKNFMEQEDDNE